jgi:hypothetical protein
MRPASFGTITTPAQKSSAPTTFGAGGTQATTRFVLASSHPGYDVAAAF